MLPNFHNLDMFGVPCNSIESLPIDACIFKCYLTVCYSIFLTGTQFGTPIEISLCYFDNFNHPQRTSQFRSVRNM